MPLTFLVCSFEIFCYLHVLHIRGGFLSAYNPWSFDCNLFQTFIAGATGFGFTIAGQSPCMLSYVVVGCPAAEAGLRQGDFLLSINGINVSRASHDDVVCLIGSSVDILDVQVGEKTAQGVEGASDEEGINKAHQRKRLQQNHPERHPLADRNFIEDFDPRSGGMSTRQENQHFSFLKKLSREVPQSHESTDKHRISDKVRKSRHDTEETINNAEVNSSQNFILNAASLISLDNKRESPILRDGWKEKRSEGSFHKSRSNKAVVDLLIQQRNQPQDHTVKSQESINSSNNQPQPELAQETGQDDASLETTKRKKANVERNPQTGDLPKALHSLVRPDLAYGGDFNLDIMLLVVVGYVGSVDMPSSETGLPDERLKAIRNCVKRLRVDRKMHTLVLMEVRKNRVHLRNTDRMVIATYPADEIAFCGVCPDDKRFFGIVTLHIDDEAEELCYSSSCHVFFIDARLRSHEQHASKASMFGISCTIDIESELCLEFPRSATPILRAVAMLYKQQMGSSQKLIKKKTDSGESKSNREGTRSKTNPERRTSVHGAVGTQMQNTWSKDSNQPAFTSVPNLDKEQHNYEKRLSKADRKVASTALTLTEASKADFSKTRVIAIDSHRETKETKSESVSSVSSCELSDKFNVTHERDKNIRTVTTPQLPAEGKLCEDNLRVICNSLSQLTDCSALQQHQKQLNTDGPSKNPSLNVTQLVYRTQTFPVANTASSLDVRKDSSSFRCSEDLSVHLAALPPTPVKIVRNHSFNMPSAFQRTYMSNSSHDEPNSADNLRASFHRLLEKRKWQTSQMAHAEKAVLEPSSPPPKMQSSSFRSIDSSQQIVALFPVETSQHAEVDLNQVIICSKLYFSICVKFVFDR